MNPRTATEAATAAPCPLGGRGRRWRLRWPRWGRLRWLWRQHGGNPFPLMAGLAAASDDPTPTCRPAALDDSHDAADDSAVGQYVKTIRRYVVEVEK